ncbi:MAG: hypothetical protein NW223_23965 [Hyphomicrobiaceae bacterium]|nr:hypothetical protein [Hyphomicrobiaceae bacterium]
MYAFNGTLNGIAGGNGVLNRVSGQLVYTSSSPVPNMARRYVLTCSPAKRKF